MYCTMVLPTRHISILLSLLFISLLRFPPLASGRGVSQKHRQRNKDRHKKHRSPLPAITSKALYPDCSIPTVPLDYGKDKFWSNDRIYNSCNFESESRLEVGEDGRVRLLNCSSPATYFSEKMGPCKASKSEKDLEQPFPEGGGGIPLRDEEMVWVLCGKKPSESHLIFRNVQNQTLFAALQEKRRKSRGTAYGVEFLVLDGMSGNDERRMLRNTVAYLEALPRYHPGKNYSQEKGHVHFHYPVHVLAGHSTMANTMALWTGELESPWWLKERIFNPNPDYIQNHFQRAGYATMVASDIAKDNPPLRPYYGEWANYSKLTRPDHTTHTVARCGVNWSALLKIGSPHPRCLGKEALVSRILNYTEQFHRNYKGVGRWSYTHLHDSHADRMNVMVTNDLPVKRHLEHMTANYPDTFIIFMSDHGPRFGEYRSSEGGIIDFKFPFLHVLVPASFLGQNGAAARALEANQHHMTTKYDLWNLQRELVAMAEGEPPIDLPKGNYSLLRDLVPRTCKEASTPAPYCACSATFSQGSSSEAARSMLDKVNQDVVNRTFGGERSPCRKLTYSHRGSALTSIWDSGVKDGKRYQTNVTVISVVASVQASKRKVELEGIRVDNGSWLIMRLSVYKKSDKKICEPFAVRNRINPDICVCG